MLTFKAKGGKAVRKECDAAKLVRAIPILRQLPGKRLFQYRDASGIVRTVSTTTVNSFLREIAGIKISLKDFRTLMASAVVLELLSRISPATSERGRKRQVVDAIRAAADQLSNTPAICRKSYVHDTIVTAFEDGILERFAATMKGYRTQKKREQLLAQVVLAARPSVSISLLPEIADNFHGYGDAPCHLSALRLTVRDEARKNTPPRSRDGIPPECLPNDRPSTSRGRRECRAHCAPAASRAK